MQPDIEKLARVIATNLGFPFDHALADKKEWTDLQGRKGGRFHDINEPFQSDYLDAAKAILSALTEQGFVVVPEGPTEVMIEAGADYGPIGCCNLDYCDAHNIYRAMLAAHKGTAHETR